MQRFGLEVAAVAVRPWLDLFDVPQGVVVAELRFADGRRRRQARKYSAEIGVAEPAEEPVVARSAAKHVVAAASFESSSPPAVTVVVLGACTVSGALLPPFSHQEGVHAGLLVDVLAVVDALALAADVDEHDVRSGARDKSMLGAEAFFSLDLGPNDNYRTV